MSCNQISRSGTIQLNSGSLGSSFCHKSWQKTYEDFIAATSASFTNGAVFSAGSSEPTSDGEIWFKQSPNNASPPCDAQGWHWKTGGSWVPVPVPAAALPTISPALPTAAQGSSTKNAQITVDSTGRVTALTEVDPAAEVTDGHAKAWVKFNSTSSGASNIGTPYNISGVNRTGIGTFSITTTDVGYSNVCLAIASSPGFGAEDQTAGSYTGADHVRILSTTISNGQGTATVELPRMVAAAENTTDGDVDWDNDKGEAPTAGVSIVFFGN